MKGVFRVWSLDDGTLIIRCGKCGYRLIVSKEVLAEARSRTVAGAVQRIQPPNSLTDHITQQSQVKT